ncbi:MAG TPA: MFS transporter [Mycobacteriales bacterium]|nr:MFS transporter [Mycobacteriales bacterium]
MSVGSVRTYRELFGIGEFRRLFGVTCTRSVGGTMEGIALATLIYGRTNSPLLSALSMFGPSAAQVLGATTLLSWVDRVRPRAALVVAGSAYTVVALLLAVPRPTWWLLTVALISGLIGTIGGGVQWGLVREIVPASGYVLARSTFTVAAGLTQILGFGVGGVLVNIIGSRDTFLIAAAMFAWSAVTARIGLDDRPRRRDEKASVRTTMRDNLVLLGTPERLSLYVMLWVPNGLIVGCEALFIPYAPHRAGVLLSAAALGMLSGDVLVARILTPRAQGRSAGLLRLVLAAPYLLFALHLPLLIASFAVALASIGYAAGLLLQQRLLALVGDEMAGHALGLHSSGMLSMQAVAAVLAGSLAEVVAPATAMVLLATASIAVTLAMASRLRAGDQWIAASGGRGRRSLSGQTPTDSRKR